MGFKTYIKFLIGSVRAKSAHLGSTKDIYIGKDVNIKGGVHIHIGQGVTIRSHADVWCSSSGDLTIGDGSEIGERSRISAVNKIVIGKKVLLSPNIYISDCDHAYQDISIPVIDQGTVKSDFSVTIGDDSYIGINTVIVGNVTIGKHCVIGANSMVTKDIPDYCVVAGNPAKILRIYDFTSNCWKKNDNT